MAAAAEATTVVAQPTTGAAGAAATQSRRGPFSPTRRPMSAATPTGFCTSLPSVPPGATPRLIWERRFALLALLGLFRLRAPRHVPVPVLLEARKARLNNKRVTFVQPESIRPRDRRAFPVRRGPIPQTLALQCVRDV